ncbi:hypothetical protein [Algoriphagus mannitolivorans]|uniref:hypothetical protein n=1 Tax=Algoriphagus mannitolivorans TaxID=226504 RepID=UPI00047A78E6|nr:hypothetical protein [Algoriphagus mannitolivorans]
MIEQDQFVIARKALKKLHPKWSLFIDEMMDLLLPFWKGSQSKERVHFIHLIGYGKRQKAREILTDLMELLDWQSEAVFLWNNWDINSPSAFSQAIGLQGLYRQFPKVVLTDFLTEFFAQAYFEEDQCDEFLRVKDFLRTRKQLDFKSGLTPLDARGGLIISFLESFGESDFVRTRVMFQFLMENPIPYLEVLRKSFIPEDLSLMIRKGYVFREDLVFFSKDEPRHIQMAFDLVKIKTALEERGTEVLKTAVQLSFNAMDYFISYIFYQKLSAFQLRQAAMDFFLPVLMRYPTHSKNINLNPSHILLDFKGGWIFHSITD